MKFTHISLHLLPQVIPHAIRPGGGGGGGGGGLGMCRWMGSYFYDWIDYNGVAFSIKVLEWGQIFSHFWGKTAGLHT